MTNELHEALERFNSLPDDAILPSRITGIILGVSERTIRYHPYLPRVVTGKGWATSASSRVKECHRRRRDEHPRRQIGNAQHPGLPLPAQ
jgi:hypothetical protein